jgi:phosphinothricin acetyltransferase
MRLLRADISHLPFITEVYNASIPSRISTADPHPVSVESRMEWFVKHGPERPLYIIEEDGLHIGWAGFSDFYGRPAYKGTAEVSIYLLEAHQFRGIGRQVMQELIRLAPALGITTLLAFVFSENKASVKLMEKSGFETWGVLPGVAAMDNQKIDLTILGRKVS